MRPHPDLMPLDPPIAHVTWALAWFFLILMLLLLLRHLFRIFLRHVRRERRKKAERRARQRRAAEAKARKLLTTADPLLRQWMAKKAGIDENQLVDPREEDVLRIARTIELPMLESLRIATEPSPIRIDARSKKEVVAVPYPTGDIRIERMTDFAQLPQMLPEYGLLDDDSFYAMVALNEIVVQQSYEERVTVKKRLYILLDVSYSMQEGTGDGYPRYVWARGTVVNLLLEALHGDSEYLLRTFYGGYGKLHEVNDRRSASALIETLLSQAYLAEDTNIMKALRIAAKDIRSRETTDCNEILLITDGEDEKVTEKKLRDVLKDDIVLHVAKIAGRPSLPLRNASKTYFERG